MAGNRIDEIVEKVQELSPLPAIARHVMAIAEDDRFSAYDLAAVVSADQALTAKLLRLANSAYYGFPRRIATVRDAVVLLGFREVKFAAMATSLTDFGSKGTPSSTYSVDLFWGHAIACGIVAEGLARETGLATVDEAFTAGMLHDIGQLVLNTHEPRFGAIVSQALAQDRKLVDVEREELGFTHAEVGRALAERWQFPTQLVDAIGLHHDLELVSDRHALCYVIAQANIICHRYGLWCGFDAETAIATHDDFHRDDALFESATRALGGEETLARRIHSFLVSTVGDETIRLHRAVRAAIATGGDPDASP